MQRQLRSEVERRGVRRGNERRFVGTTSNVDSCPASLLSQPKAPVRRHFDQLRLFQFQQDGRGGHFAGGRVERTIELHQLAFRPREELDVERRKVRLRKRPVAEVSLQVLQHFLDGPSEWSVANTHAVHAPFLGRSSSRAARRTLPA